MTSDVVRLGAARRAHPARGATGILAVLGSLALTVSAGSAAMPAGQFVVVAAPRHPAVSNMQASYRPDDPRLVNRIVVLDGGRATFDGAAMACDSATGTTTRVAVGDLIRRIFPGRADHGKTYVSKPADFRLTLAPTRIVTATRFQCLRARGNHGEEWTGVTLFPLEEGRWALSLIDDHLLILAPAIGPIRASFDCAKAGSPTERTICSDRLLAGWDRSVADAYRQGGGDVADQRAWLAGRNACGTDKACLQLSMSNRADTLLRQ
jgi:hypothetical protein